MTPATKIRAPRLRASCDGCFLAKVKCSKSRPVCSRCLACGTVCNYSPSSRAGKPKPENNNSPRLPTVQHPQPLPILLGDNSVSYLPQTVQTPVFSFARAWGMPSTSGDGPMVRNPSLASNIGLLGLDENFFSQLDPMAAQPDFYQPQPQPSWSSATNVPDTGIYTPTTSIQMPFTQSEAIDSSMSTWMEQELQPQHMALNPQTSALSHGFSNYLPSPNTTPTQPPLPLRPNGTTCACFSGCLQVLQDLHNSSFQGPMPFEVVMNVNDMAVDGCNTMMACKMCFGPPGQDTSAPLAANIFRNIALSYSNEIYDCKYRDDGMSESAPNGMMNGGTYTPNGEEKQVREGRLDHALLKLEGAVSRFHTQCHSESGAVKALIDDVSQAINSCRAFLEYVPPDRNSNQLEYGPPEGETNLLDTTVWNSVKGEL
ncbi:hypothetical protein F4801DRAFT_576373 [Xylaria longipes]|nr:hypothetical protein F4801DRAFT_576373 [Xylaria longipes]